MHRETAWSDWLQAYRSAVDRMDIPGARSVLDSWYGALQRLDDEPRARQEALSATLDLLAFIASAMERVFESGDVVNDLVTWTGAQVARLPGGEPARVRAFQILQDMIFRAVELGGSVLANAAWDHLIRLPIREEWQALEAAIDRRLQAARVDDWARSDLVSLKVEWYRAHGDPGAARRVLRDQGLRRPPGHGGDKPDHID